jgi:hypothetical protein
VTPVAGREQRTLTRSPGVRCFLQNIGAEIGEIGIARNRGEKRAKENNNKKEVAGLVIAMEGLN